MKFLRTIATAAVIGVLFACTSIAHGQTDNCIALANCVSTQCSKSLATYNSQLEAWNKICAPITVWVDVPGGKPPKKEVTEPNPACHNTPKPTDPTIGTAAKSCFKQYKCTSGSGEYVLDYEIADLMYSPPGKKSNVTYTNGSAVGSTWGLTLGSQYTSQTTVGVTASIGEPGIASFSAGASYITGSGNSTSNASQIQITTTMSQATGLSSPTTDSVDHGEDTFFIWAHPMLTVLGAAVFNSGSPITTGCHSPGPIKIQINAPGAQNLVSFTANELLGTESVPPDKAQIFSELSSQDKQAILATDPFVSGTLTTPPSPRFVNLNTTLQEDGPDNSNSGVVTNGITLVSQVAQTTTTTETQTESSGVGVNSSAMGGFPLFDGGPTLSFTASVSNNQVWTTSAATSTGTSSATQVTAATTLATSTVGYEDLIDIYMDQLYHTYVFVSETGGKGIPASEKPTLSGTVTRLGTVVPNQLVVLTFPNGVVRRVMTNAQGVYRVYRAPSGVAKVEAAGQEAPEITIEEHKPIVKNIELM
jgi:hypothetical protein